MSSVATVRRFRALPPSDRAALVHAAVLLVAARALLAAPGVPVRRVAGAVASLARRLPAPGRAAASLPPERLGWAVGVAGEHLPVTTTCLPRALVARSLLARHGYTASLRIGVDRDGDGVEAHAWVERDGAVLVGNLPDLDRFVPLPLDDL